MSLLDRLSEREVWEDFLSYRKDHSQLTRSEEKKLESFVREEGYMRVVRDMKFSYPEKKVIAKLGSEKKRTVYSYDEDEMWVLKLLAWLLYRYDDRLCGNCYSFRRSQTAKNAWDDIMRIRDLDEKHVLKLDIHDYFNSIDTDLLLVILREVIDDDERLYDFLVYLYTQDRCICNGEVIEEKRGGMAGVPLASFMANIYLLSLDRQFESQNIPYLRYSDDIIVFCDDHEQLERCEQIIRERLREMKLEVNEDKYSVSMPHECWEFLGFRYEKGEIDLSSATVEKMKGKIARKARKLYRWRKRNDVPYERALKAMIRSFDHKFYDLTGDNSFTWTRFYFPVVTVTAGLHAIDEYMIMYMRYLYSGRHYKGNYEVTYEDIKKAGYTPLVAEYYNWKRENRELREMNSQKEHEAVRG